MPKYFTEADEATLLLLKVRSSDFWLPAFLENIVLELTYFGLIVLTFYLMALKM